MKRAIGFAPSVLLVLSVLFSCGCVTGRAKVGARRAELYAAARGASGDALGVAVAREMGEVNRELGADALSPEAAPLTVAAAEANAAGISSERQAREDTWDGLLALLGLGGTGGAALGLLIKALRSGRALDSAKKALGAAITLTQSVKEKLKGGGLTYADFQKVYAAAQQSGPEFVEGAGELYAEYQKMKQEWRAESTASGNNPAPAAPSS